MKKVNFIYSYLPGMVLRFSVILSCYTIIQLLISVEGKAEIRAKEIFLALFISSITTLFDAMRERSQTKKNET